MWPYALPLGHFYPRPPRGGRLRLHLPPCFRAVISIHALREEGDGPVCVGDLSDIISIHALREEGDQFFFDRARAALHFYPRPPRGGRRQNAIDINARIGISIHALREEGDLSTISPLQDFANFYPRPPRGGRRKCKRCGVVFLAFLSTPSARRATALQGATALHPQNFYPRPPRGGRRIVEVVFKFSKKFLSTPSARRATSHR